MFQCCQLCVGCIDVSIDFATLCGLSFLFHLPCDISLMYGRYPFNALSFKAPVVYLLFFFKIAVAMLRPSFSPFLDLFGLVPVVGFDCLPLPHLPTSCPYLLFSSLWVNLWYLLSVLVQFVGFLLFLPPLPILFYWSCRSHDVCVVVALFPVNIYINAHSLVSKALCVPSDKLLALFKGQLMRKCYFPFSGKPCVALLLYFLDCVPKCFPVLVFPRSILAKDNFRIGNFCFVSVIVRQSCFSIFQLLASTI